MSHRDQPDVLVLGGGVIGLSVAWRASQQGMSVALLERDATGSAASRVAAGMLAPVAEVEFGAAGERILRLGLASLERWPAFAAELLRETGVDVGLLRSGTLLLARDEDDARELDRQLAFRQSLALAVRRLRASQARELEDALAPSVRMALEAPDDHSVEPRLLLSALRSACEAAGVRVREGAAVASVLLDGSRRRAIGVQLASGERMMAGQVVVAAGAWSGQLGGLPSELRVPVRPVKGQIMRLRDPAGAGLVGRVLRFRGGYIVPRADGRYVLGATVEERGFDSHPTAGGMYELLRHAHELVPGIGELDVEEVSVGFRPGTPDNAPAIGAGAIDGLVWATGHYRNGILLAPLTAELTVAALAGARGEPASLLAACDPARFLPASVIERHREAVAVGS